MSETLISLNPDLARLEAAGLRLRIIEGKSATHLIIDGICAVNSKREVITGSLYSPLEIEQNRKTRNPVGSHQCWWMGAGAPGDPAGVVMSEFMSNKDPEDKGDAIRTLVGFSMKWKQ